MLMSDRWDEARRYLLGAALMLIGIVLGLRLPDIDLWLRMPPFFEHRSLLTHGFIVPLCLFLSLQRNTKPHNNQILRLFWTGFVLSVLVHLCFDLFPRRWYGYALVHVPLVRWTIPAFSMVWLSVSTLVCLYLICRSLRSIEELSLIVMAGLVAFGMAANQQPGLALPALFALIIASGLAFILPRPAPLRQYQ